MKQTAVEWLVEQICGDHTSEWQEQIDQAKEIEKQQIIDAWNTKSKIDGVLTHTDNRTAEQYYKETFKSE
jgi:hypothetical protein